MVTFKLKSGCLLLGLALLISSSTGCAIGKRWASWRTRTPAPTSHTYSPTPTAIPSAAHAAALPSRSQTRPVSLGLPESGRYDADSIAAMRAQRSSFGGFRRGGGAACRS